MSTDAPLSRQELDWLGDALLDRVDEDAVTDDTDEGILGIPGLDGFLTAIVSGPEIVMPSRWMPAVWGDFEPTWDSLADVQKFMSLTMRHMNSIVSLLMNDPEAFEPIFYERKVEGEQSSSWTSGAKGTCGAFVCRRRRGAPEAPRSRRSCFRFARSRGRRTGSPTIAPTTKSTGCKG